MDFKKILDSKIGADVRELGVAVGGVAVAADMVLRDLLDLDHALPSSGVTAKVAALLVGALALVGRFTKLGNRSGGAQ